MNEILKKRIEEAAVEYAESIPQSDERREYSREDFIAGAEWRINSVWHDASEEPERNGEPMLVEFHDFGMDENDYDVVEDLQGYRTGIYVEFKRWAYVSELLPKRKKD